MSVPRWLVATGCYYEAAARPTTEGEALSNPTPQLRVKV